MSLNYPDFLNDFKLPSNANNLERNNGDKQDTTNGQDNFNDILFKKLTDLEHSKSPTSRSPLRGPFSPIQQPQNPFYSGVSSVNWDLPLELQGGISNIHSRRPSYAAESFTRPPPFSNFQPFNNFQPFSQPQTLAVPVPGGQLTVNGNEPVNYGRHSSGNEFQTNYLKYATSNNYFMNELNDDFGKFNLNSNFNDFQSRRPSQLVDLPTQLPYQVNEESVTSKSTTTPMVNLENGLILKDHYILASPELKQLFLKTTKYFHDPVLCDTIIREMNQLLSEPVILKLITFIKNLNNLNFNHKLLCLITNKNGKFDLLSYSHNSNLSLCRNDLVIVDGDRGKDLVMVLEPLVNLNFAILFNFIKKLEHLRSLKIDDGTNSTNSSSLAASTIINTLNQDNEFIITLPTKQVLRFATPKEIQKISGKFLEEKKAFITCFNKIKELKLESNLKLINVEYQLDFKKLIFYYFANFKRVDFRSLIKELFKIYKTRIWLCAVLPSDNPELIDNVKRLKPLIAEIPKEYRMNNDETLGFSIDKFQEFELHYFHSKNLFNLVEILKKDINGFFYGFNPI